MKRLKTYKEYNESIVIDSQFQRIDLMESLNIWQDDLLESISASEENIFDVFKLDKDFYHGRLDLDFLCNNIEFINSLSSISLKKSAIQNTDDYQCFINKPCKFMFIYGSESNELEEPLFILTQIWNDTAKQWDDVKLYKVNDVVSKFYDKLSSKTIEIIDGDENYIYSTSNSGNDFELQNLDKENDIYQRYFRKEQIEELVNDRKVKVTII